LVSEERFEEGGVACYGYGYSDEGHVEWEDLGGELGGEHGEISAIQADDHNRYRNSSVPVSSNGDSRNPLLIVPKAVGLSNESDIFERDLILLILNCLESLFNIVDFFRVISLY